LLCISSQKSPDVLHVPTKDHYGGDHFTPASGKQALYTGSDISIAYVEPLTILAKSIGEPQEVLGQLVTYFRDDATLAKSVPLQESHTKGKNVLGQTIPNATNIYLD